MNLDPRSAILGRCLQSSVQTRRAHGMIRRWLSIRQKFIGSGPITDF
jgi:hypothetical protein